MADIEVHLKNPTYFTLDTPQDITAARGRMQVIIIIDGPAVTVRLRLDWQEAEKLARKLLVMPEAQNSKGG